MSQIRPLLKFLFALTFVLLHPILSSYGDGSMGERANYQFDGANLNALVNVKGGIYLRGGDAVGFHFDLLNKFATHQKCNIKVSPAERESPWEKLISGDIDILVVDANIDTIPDLYSDRVISSLELNQSNQVWVVTKENYPILQHLNHWFGYYNETKEYKGMVERYYRNYNRFSSKKVRVLSPYDKIIKEQAKELGWDWRLLASIIYQESKFSVAAKSHRDAHGLMQLLPSTAKVYNVEDLYDPEENIRAGVLFLKRLQGLYRGEEIDSINKVKFTLAAYNAGEGRVEDIRRAAQFKSLDPNNWEGLKEAIPYMSKRGEFPKDFLRHGLFKGVETLNYVEEVLERYQNYRETVI